MFFLNSRSAGCAAYMAPERIDPPNPSKPDYDIRADVWSLGITLVELATGHFPYRDCKTDLEVLTKVLQDKPPLLPRNGGFSVEFCSFVQVRNKIAIVGTSMSRLQGEGQHISYIFNVFGGFWVTFTGVLGSFLRHLKPPKNNCWCLWGTPTITAIQLGSE